MRFEVRPIAAVGAIHLRLCPHVPRHYHRRAGRFSIGKEQRKRDNRPVALKTGLPGSGRRRKSYPHVRQA